MPNIMFSPSVILTDADIKALPTTPFQLVAAQGVGKAIVPIFVSGVADITAGAYTGIADASLSLFMNNGAINNLFISEGMLGSPTKFYFQIPATIIGIGSGSFSGEVTSSFALDAASMDNKALYLKDDWAGLSNYGGGNAANTMIIRVYYIVIDL